MSSPTGAIFHKFVAALQHNGTTDAALLRSQGEGLLNTIAILSLLIWPLVGLLDSGYVGGPAPIAYQRGA